MIPNTVCGGRGQGAWAYLPVKHGDVDGNVVVELCGDACAKVHHDVGVLGTVHWGTEGGAYMHDCHMHMID